MTDETLTQDSSASPASTAVGAGRESLVWYLAAAVFTLTGLAASSSLLVDYLRPTPLFCADSGGCGALRASAYGWVGSVPVPAFGVVGYVALATALLLRGPLARAIYVLFAGLGGAVAALLILVQLRMGVYCTYCLIVDSSTLALLVLAVVRLRNELDRPGGLVFATAPAGAFVAAFAAPVTWGVIAKVPVPADVALEIAKTPSGQVTVVDYVDYECPYCRQMHADLSPALDAHPGKIRLVRKNVPLSSIHPHAMTAARAACCAEAQGKLEPMANALFTAPPADLTDEGCASIASGVGLDTAKFKACMDDPATSARIQSELDGFRAQGGHGLPTLWIDKNKIEGARGRDAIRAAIESAMADHGS